MDPIKWYSAALKAAEALPQNFGTSDQMAAMLSKYGAKASELNYLGVPKFMSQFDKRVPKQALVDFIDEHKVLPTEVVKSGRSAIRDDPVIQAGAIADNPQLFEDLTSLRHNALTPGQRMNAVNAVPDFEFENFIANHPEQFGGNSNSSKYSVYATHPDSGYKETLLTLPGKHQPVDADRINQLATNYLNNPSGFGLPEDIAPQAARDLAAKRLNASSPPLYQSSHWDEPNVLLHLRTSGKPQDFGDGDAGTVPFLEELQSDWGQAGRKQGFKGTFDPERNTLRSRLNNGEGSINPAPLVTNTNDWASAGVRRFLAEAAQQDAPQVAWTTGQQQSARYSGHAPDGMSGFYDQMLPNIINKYIKPYGGQVSLAPAASQFKIHYRDNPYSDYAYRPEEADAALARIRLQNAPYDNPEDFRLVPEPATGPRASDTSPHTATLPQSFRDQIMKNGIPFFKHGGTVDYYANQPVEG